MYNITACSPGTYRTLSDSTCQRCPSNTRMDAAEASVCSCQDGFYRSPQEGPETGCIGKDSQAPQNLVLELYNVLSISVAQHPLLAVLISK